MFSIGLGELLFCLLVVGGVVFLVKKFSVPKDGPPR